MGKSRVCEQFRILCCFWRGVTLLPLLVGMLLSQSVSASVEGLVKQEEQQQKLAVSTQNTVIKRDDQLIARQAELRQLGYELQLQTKYQQQLSHQLNQLQLAMAGLESRLDDVRAVKVQLRPTMENMIVVLARLVKADVPFQLTERMARVVLLQEALNDPTTTDAELLGDILSAYQRELAYGNQVVTWTERLDDQRVHFLRVGRIGYYHVSMDYTRGARWSTQHSWVTLSQAELDAVAHALQQVQQSTFTVAPTALQLPLPLLETTATPTPETPHFSHEPHSHEPHSHEEEQ